MSATSNHPPAAPVADQVDEPRAEPNPSDVGESALDAQRAGDLATRMAALADPTRLQMLSIIGATASGEVCACDFVAPIGKSQPTVSHHLRVLAEAGLIEGTKRGRWVWYRLARGGVGSLVADLAGALGHRQD